MRHSIQEFLVALAVVVVAAGAAATGAAEPPAAAAPDDPAPAGAAPSTAPAAAPKAAAAEGEMVTFEAAGEKVEAYLVRPAAGGKGRAGVVVIQEWWGLNDQIKGVTDRVAGLGYVAIAPDLYRGKATTDPGLAHELVRGLAENRAVDIIKGAAAHLRALDGEKDRRVGTVGFCMGGRLSLATALKGGDLQAAVMFYGSVETSKEALAGLACPLLGLFGATDNGIPVDEVKRFEETLKAAGKTAEIRIYEGAGHAFFNETRPVYNKAAAEDAWGRLKAFFARHLGGGGRGAGG